MNPTYFRKAYVRIMTWLRLAIDIHSKGRWPGYALSNFYPHEFEFDGVKCASMEGFLQAIKTADPQRQKTICALSGKEAKKHSTDTWKKEQNLYWNGRVFNRHGNHFQFLLRRAYRAMFNQCPKFREALQASGSRRLYHTIGNPDSHDTILTEKELCTILCEFRTELMIERIFDKA